MKRLLSLICFLLVSTAAFGQSYLNDTGSPEYAVQIPVENGYIDLSNGNLHLEFPLASIPQRGVLNSTEKLTYDSRIWAWHATGYSYYWAPDNVYGTSLSGGWRFHNGRSQGAWQLLPNGINSNPCYDDNGNQLGTDTDYQWQLAYVDDSGVAHPTGATETMDDDEGCPDWSETTTYTPGWAGDGSGYYIALDGSGYPYVLDPDGNEVYPASVDRYGNYLSTDVSGNTMDDTGRVPVIVTQHSSTVTYYDVLSPAGPISNNGTRVRYVVTTSPISVTTAFGVTFIPDYTGTLNPITNIQLPDSSSYSFTYDGYGELTSVTLPTGGTITYAHNNFTDSTGEINRWLYSRKVGSSSSLETFTPAVTGCSGCQQVTHHEPSGDESVYAQTINNGAWTTGISTYTGSATASTPVQLTQATFSNIYANPCTITGGYSGCVYGWSYALGSLTTTKIFSSSGGSPIYTQTYSDSFRPGKPSFTKTWDYTSSAPTTSIYTPPSSTPTHETDYTYTNSTSAIPPWDIQTVKALNSSGAQVALTTNGYTGSPASTTTGITQHGSAPSTPEYLHTVTQWENVGSSPVTTYSMDDTGEVTSVQDPNVNPGTTITYQCSHSLPLLIEPLGSATYKTTYGYDCGSAAITSAQDPNGNTTSYSYEATAGRLQTITYPDTGSTSYAYISPTEVDTTVLASPDPSIITQSYLDPYGRADHTLQNGITSGISYDIDGRVSCKTNPYASTSDPTYGNTCITSYDGLDRPLVQQQADGSSTLQLTYTVDATALMAITKATDEAGNQVQRASNALGQLASVVEPGPLTTNYTYDGLGNLTKINQLGNGTTDSPRVRTFTYDSLSRLLCASNPESSSASCPTTATSSYTSGTVGYAYDANGNATSTEDARGVTVTNTYDALNRLTARTASGINYQYTYDSRSGQPNTNSIGKLVYAWNGVTGVGAAAEGFSYDAMGRLKWQTSWTPSSWSSGGNLETASYDKAGNMTDFTYPDGHHIQQAFNSSGQSTAIKYADWTGTTVNYPYVSNITYSPLGGMSSITLGNGVVENVSYNNRSQPCEIAASYPVTPGSSTMAFAYDKQYYFSSGGGGGVCGAVTGNNGNVWSIDDALNSTAKKQSFSFDSLNRLTGGTRADNQFNYTYNMDSFGNMQQQNNNTSNPTITFPGTSNQLQVALGYSYDAAGNLTDTGSSSGGHHYTYDSIGQQTQVDYGTTGTYIYDAMGSRIRKNASGSWTEYVNFGGKTVAEWHPDNTWQDNIYANGQLVARDHSADTYIEFTGTNSTSGLYSMYYLPLPSGGIPIHAAIGSAHAKLVWRQRQSGAAVPKGGIGVVTSSTNLDWVATDQDSQVINSDTTQNTWHNRVVDLNSIAGQTVSSMWVNEDTNTGAGAWTEDFADIAIVQPDGTVTTLYNNQVGQTYSGSSSSGVSSQTFSENVTSNPYIPSDSTHYFLADHLGSNRMEFAGPGWPVWGEDYAPYGQEVSPTGSPEATSNIYKFTGYERDTETNIAAGTEEDYAQARYYSSAIQGRFMSPDPYSGSMNLANPQSFNRYTYAMNNPLKFIDPSGMDCVVSDENGGWNFVPGDCPGIDPDNEFYVCDGCLQQGGGDPTGTMDGNTLTLTGNDGESYTIDGFDYTDPFGDVSSSITVTTPLPPQIDQLLRLIPIMPGQSPPPSSGVLANTTNNSETGPAPSNPPTPKPPPPTPQQQEQQLKDKIGHGCTVVSGGLMLGDLAITFTGQEYLVPAAWSISAHVWAACGWLTW